MEPELFTIELVNNSRPVVYYVAGETIHGVVHVIIGPRQICKCEGISITVRGKAAFTRMVLVGKYNFPMPREEIYLDNTRWLLDPETEIKLSPGNYDYPFGFTLPPDLPSTVVTSTGSIAYELQIEMITGTGYFHNNPKASVSFHLNSVVDLNLEPFAQFAAHPVQMEKYKTICCCCCESGPLGFSVTVTRGGYALGETIQFTAELSNKSKSRVGDVTASFVQKVIYRYQPDQPYPDQYDIKTICSAEGPSVEPSSEEIWTVNDFEIPPMIPTSTIKRILEVQYFLTIEMHVPDSVTNLKHEIPILIGTVPLRSKASTLHTKNVHKEGYKPGKSHHFKEKKNGKK